MRLARAGGCLLLLVACKAATEAEDPDAIAPLDTDVDTDAPPPAPTSDFRESTWVVDDLSILEDTDLDDDGTIDNKLPQVLAAVDTLMRNEDMSVAQVNQNIASNIAQLVTIVFLDARSPDGEAIEIDVLAGLSEDGVVSVDPSSYDEDGTPRSQLAGGFVGPLDFEATGDVAIRITMMPGIDPSPVQLHAVVLDASMTDSQLVVTGLMRGVIPVDRFIDEAIAPVIPDAGYEIFPGTQSSKAEVLAILHDLAPGLADVTLPNGEVGISAAFEIVAGQWDFSTP
ncbi:MAG: hypothetical protein H6737_15810 [Alphaproteobacteria bacterium]|nr:hypothetical protein [Alphaproteobacteria bacterium]